MSVGGDGKGSFGVLITFYFLIRVLVIEACSVCEHLTNYILKICTFLHVLYFSEQVKNKQTNTQTNILGGLIFSLEKSRQRLNQSPVSRGRNKTRDWAACPESSSSVFSQLENTMSIYMSI